MQTEDAHEALLSVRGLGIRYRHFNRRDGWVISDIDFDLRKGETLGVLGRNGAGKSSLLRVLSGVTTPDTGHVFCKPGTRASLLTVNLGFEPHLPMRENVMLVGMLLGMRKREIAARYSEIVDFTGLDVDPEQKVGTFSSGMRARLALGIALVAAPDIILIDELLGVGDGQFREKSAQAIKDLMNTDRSVVLVTHNLQMLNQLADRVLWIEDGAPRMLDQSEIVVAAYREFLKDLQQPA